MDLAEHTKPYGTRVSMAKAPELPEVPDADRPLLQNILYTLWILQEGGETPVSWNVANHSFGYVVTVSFGLDFSLSLVDLQIVKDLSPLRIENVFVRNALRTDNKLGCSVVVKVLNSMQKVTITEAEVIRVQKRKKGWFGT